MWRNPYCKSPFPANYIIWTEYQCSWSPQALKIGLRTKMMLKLLLLESRWILNSFKRNGSNGINLIQIQYRNGTGGNVTWEWNDKCPMLQARRERWGKAVSGLQTVEALQQEPVWSRRASQRHSSCSWPARLPETTGRSPFWHFPQSHCRGWCSCWKWGRNVLGWRSTRWVQSFKNMQLQTHLLTSMQKSPLMVPGLDSAGLVSPSITLPVFTTPLPSHT